MWHPHEDPGEKLLGQSKERYNYVLKTHQNTHKTYKTQTLTHTCPPKPAGNNGDPGARTRRTETGTPSRMSHDTAEAATAPSSEVHSEADAMRWMVEGVYLVEGESVTAKKLLHVMLQIAASIPKLTKQGANAFRAAAFILEGLTVEQEGKATGDAVGAHFGAALKEQLKAVKETTAEMATHGKSMAIAAEAVQEMLARGVAQGTDNATGSNTQLADAVGNVLACTEEAVHILKEEKKQRTTQMTYVAKVRGNAPPQLRAGGVSGQGQSP